MFRSYLIKASGTKFDGIPKGSGIDKFAVATDLQTFSAFYPQIKGLTKKKVRTKLKNARKEFKIQ